MATTPTRSTGRPRESCVWNFFKYLKEDKSILVAEIKDYSSQLCGHSFKGKFPTNLKTHLKKVHHQEYQELLKMESDKKIAESRKAQRKSSSSTTFTGGVLSAQMTLHDTMGGRKYGCQSDRYCSITLFSVDRLMQLSVSLKMIALNYSLKH